MATDTRNLGKYFSKERLVLAKATYDRFCDDSPIFVDDSESQSKFDYKARTAEAFNIRLAFDMIASRQEGNPMDKQALFAVFECVGLTMQEADIDLMLAYIGDDPLTGGILGDAYSEWKVKQVTETDLKVVYNQLSRYKKLRNGYPTKGVDGDTDAIIGPEEMLAIMKDFIGDTDTVQLTIEDSNMMCDEISDNAERTIDFRTFEGFMRSQSKII